MFLFVLLAFGFIATLCLDIYVTRQHTKATYALLDYLRDIVNDHDVVDDAGYGESWERR